MRPRARVAANIIDGLGDPPARIVGPAGARLRCEHRRAAANPRAVAGLVIREAAIDDAAAADIGEPVEGVVGEAERLVLRIGLAGQVAVDVKRLGQ